MPIGKFNDHVRTFRYHGYDVFIDLAQYKNKRTAIQLLDADDGLIVCTASVNIVADKLYKDEEIAINTNDNEEIYPWLVDNGIVTKAHRYTDSGYCTYPVVYLTEPFKPLI